MQINLSFDQSIWIFLVSVILLWIFSSKLSNVVNFIDDQFKLGSSFGGTIILSIVTNLPEIAITVSGAMSGNIDLAVGNILGGIVIQSLLLVLFDFASRKEPKPLSTLVSNKTSILQGLFLIIILVLVILGKQIHQSNMMFRSTAPEILIAFSWLTSILLLKKFQSKKKDTSATPNPTNTHKYTKTSALVWLISIAIVVLVFGVLLEVTSDKIATHFNINGIIFGATILALVTSLPEISSGMAFVKAKSYQPIISDIFGGNAFLPVLFLIASLISNNPILPKAQNVDIYLTTVAIIITSVYLIGMVLKLPTRKKGMGIDSWIVIVIYLFSVIGMLYI
ncbi:sodium:calcium antiporter [Pedobacter changchengzhani]|uniref:Sodium:calcium antiporter n=1 Tax=Pedobacter changchengzhani TaxID=2529274 RepID=A0A4R5MJ37_9SPHI|nr:sodium:calcium antiporter [Pedobacter changchengzhani]TDG35581.1 sodium:calcium antiporter [Pedobacter changchengzhani]